MLAKPAHAVAHRAVLATVAVLFAAACQSTPPPGAPPAASGSDRSNHDAVNARIDRLLGPHAEYEEIIESFRRSVAVRDAPGVAALVRYPLPVVLDGTPTTVADAASFVRDFDRIVTPAMAEAITNQEYALLVVDQEGVAFGDGRARVNVVCEDEACTRSRVRVVSLSSVPAS